MIIQEHMTGDFYNEDDGYIYRDGMRLRKLFSNIPDYRSKYFWKPCLKNISRIENLLHQLSARRDFAWERLEKMFEQVMQTSDPIIRYKEKTWVLYAKPTHQYKACDDKPCQIFYLSGAVHRSSRDGFTYSSDWTAEPEINPHPELGQQFYRLVNYQRNCCFRAGRIKLFLLEAIKQHIKDRHGLNTDQRRVFQYLINGRIHWLHEAEKSQYGAPTLGWMPIQGIVSEIISTGV